VSASASANGSAPVATNPAPVPALEVAGLSSGYGRTTVLRDVALSVPAGSVAALLGSNGAGKTTLLRTVSGLLPATAGSVRLHGEDVTRDRAHRRFAAGLCHIPEGRGVFRGLTVRENLLMQAPKGHRAEAVEQAVSAFPILGKRLAQRAGTMSGGEQQMLAVAAAYTRHPTLVVVDEVSLGLAPLVLDEIFAFLASLRAKGTALLIVDQFATRALELADVAYVMRRGSISYSGSPAHLLESGVFEQYLGTGE
jgi:branched-chain amino acid transport system ATP-binding protein